jgi:hypothetical protein
MVFESILRPLILSWERKGLCFVLDGLCITNVCFADDVILVGATKAQVQAMLNQAIQDFKEPGLDINLTKCHWTSYPSHEGRTLDVDGECISWESDITFVGSRLDLLGNDEAALHYRLAQAEKVWHSWSSILRVRDVSTNMRMRTLRGAVFESALWTSQAWNLTQKQISHFNSWGARIVSKLLCCKPRPDEDMGDFYRRMYREGHHW